MNRRLIHLTVAAAVAAVPFGAQALGNNEKGCLVGGAVGGVAGHAIEGNKTLLGAAIGCGAGVLINKQRVQKNDAEAEAKKQRAIAARERAKARQLAQQQQGLPTR